MTTPATPDKHPRKPSPPLGGWPTGGTQVAGFHLCTPCGDSIYPGEHVYDNGDNTVRCAVCEIKHRPHEEPAMTAPEPTERFEWAYRWLDADGNVLDELDTRSTSWETAEDRAHRLAANRPPSIPGGAVVRYRVVTTEEVVATYPEVQS